MAMKTESWLVYPQGATEYDAIAVCSKLLRRIIFKGINQIKLEHWQESGLKCKQDPETRLWGIICNNPEIEAKIKNEKIQVEFDELWETKLKYHPVKIENLGQLKGWKGYEYTYELTHPSIAEGEKAYAMVKASIYLKERGVSSTERFKRCDFVIHWYSLIDSKNQRVDPPVLMWTHADKIKIPEKYNEDNYDELIKILTNKSYVGRINIKKELKGELSGVEYQSVGMENGAGLAVSHG